MSKESMHEQMSDVQPYSYVDIAESQHTWSLHEARMILNEQVATPEIADLGPIFLKTDIKSKIGPFTTLPEYKIQYPDVVTQALADLYTEYNYAFDPLVKANQEWDTDYQYALTGPNGTPVNRWVQIDMVGLPQGFLDHTANMDSETVREVLRGRIFEIENSLAMYQLLENIHSRNGEQTRFDWHFRKSLDELRQAYGMKVALLAVTDQKYQAMKQSEFGKGAEDPLTDDEVRYLSGFDRFFSPQDYVEHIRETGGDSQYLLFVRSSDPLDKLKKPNTKVVNPLLENDDIRRIIKAYAITFNIDKPELPPGSEVKINDTKAYLPIMGMAYRVNNIEDAWTTPNDDGNGFSVNLNPGIKEFLLTHGIDPDQVTSNLVNLRGKPMQASYGCYGHVVVRINNKKDRHELKQNLRERGPYVVQPELPTPVITNARDGKKYSYIDRNFFSSDGYNYRFMGGFRSLMPLDTVEAQQRRNHGNISTVWGEVM